MNVCLIKDQDLEWELHWRAREDDAWISVAMFRQEREALERFEEVSQRNNVAGQFRLMRIGAEQVKGPT